MSRNTQYFEVITEDDTVKLVDLNDNTTTLDRQELIELIEALTDCAKHLKEGKT